MMAGASALAIFGAVLLFAHWSFRAPGGLGLRMRALAPRGEVAERDERFTQRVIVPAYRAFMRRMTDLLPTALLRRTRGWLVTSDSAMQPSTFFAIVLLFGLGLPVVFLFVLIAGTGGIPMGRVLLLVPLVSALGFAFPLMVLRSRAGERQEKMLKLLPDTLDLLTACVEAGLSLDYAFQRVVERQRGPVTDEISRMLREKALGQTRREALTTMAERIDLPDVNVFVQSVIQAETQGTSIAGVLRTQSRQLRIRRRQRAEESAQKAGPKMVFPLVFFVMPSLFIVILGPVAIDVWGNFKGF